LHLVGDLADARHRLVVGDVGTAAVRVVEPVMLGDPQDAEAGFEFTGADLRKFQPGGQRCSSVEPSSPRVALIQTTRWPRRIASTISPAQQ
jgi:hypothetical protein